MTYDKNVVSIGDWLDRQVSVFRQSDNSQKLTNDEVQRGKAHVAAIRDELQRRRRLHRDEHCDA